MILRIGPIQVEYYSVRRATSRDQCCACFAAHAGEYRSGESPRLNMQSPTASLSDAESLSPPPARHDAGVSVTSNGKSGSKRRPSSGRITSTLDPGTRQSARKFQPGVTCKYSSNRHGNHHYVALAIYTQQQSCSRS
jgi:hypothetical protein